MIDANTNKILWVAMAVGIVAILGLSTMTIFPDAISTGENAVKQLTSKYMAITPDDDTQDDFTYGEYNEKKLTAYVTDWNGETDSDGTLSFPSTVVHNHKTYKIIGINGPMIGNDKIKKVILPDTYQDIYSAYGFMSDAPNLESINVPRDIQSIAQRGLNTLLVVDGQQLARGQEGNILVNTKVLHGFIGDSSNAVGALNKQTKLNSISVPSDWTHDDIISFVGGIGYHFSATIGRSIEIYQNGNYRGTVHPKNDGNNTGWFIDEDHKVFGLSNGYFYYQERISNGTLVYTSAWGQITNDYKNIYDVKTGHMKLTMNN